MQLEVIESTHRATVEKIITIEFSDGPEDRAVAGRWEFPLQYFVDAGYVEEQVVTGLKFAYKIRKANGAPLCVSAFQGILPPTEVVEN